MKLPAWWTASVAATLFGFWLAMSGMFTPFLLAMGAGAAVAVALLATRMQVADREGHPVHFGLAAPAYWLWLGGEIAKSGFGVARVILDPRLPISPTLVRLAPSQKTSVGLVTYANSITLTPGTVTVEADHQTFLVHALTREGAAELAAGEMDRRVCRFEGGG